MPAGVIYPKRSDADAYANEMDGDVIENPNGEGWVVVPKPMDIGKGFDEDTFSSPQNRNMGGTMDDEMGYMHGGMHGTPKKMFKGGAAIKGRGFKGNF
tara:strand:+ start:143 stop:436 length:294 start_codon:yes stop_codon:yes gene_type:complete